MRASSNVIVYLVRIRLQQFKSFGCDVVLCHQVFYNIDNGSKVIFINALVNVVQVAICNPILPAVKAPFDSKIKSIKPDMVVE